MYNKIIALIVGCIATLSTFAQTISPIVTTEFCPGVDVTFTVTVPGNNPTLGSWTNSPIIVHPISIVSTSTTSTVFTFTGRFEDANQQQVYQIGYVDGNGQEYYYPTFTHIKSLFFSTSPTTIPSQPDIAFPLCQEKTITVSFSAVKWGIYPDNTSFGSITKYEYLVPSGWKVGSTPSNGSDWIPGNTSTTVTSDLST